MIDHINLAPDDMDALLDDIEEIYNIRLEGGEVVDTAGALEEIVRKKAAPRRIQMGGAVIDVYKRLRTAMLQIPGVHANVRRPDTTWRVSAATGLETLLKGQDRHKVWHILRNGMGMQLPRLKLSAFQKFLIFLFLMAPLVALGSTMYLLHMDNTVEWTILILSFFPPVVAIIMSRRIGKTLPKGCETMADLSALMVILNIGMIKQHKLIGTPLFDQIRRLVAEHAECSAAQIERTTILEG